MSTETTQAAEYSSKNNRRFYARREVRSLAYIDLGCDNGGIVLNLSEGGLAIHSAVTLNDRGLPHIRFQLPHSPDWVEARGEIAWSSETKMQAGIQLIGLADDARRLIRDWVAGHSRGAASVPLGRQVTVRTQAVTAPEAPTNAPPTSLNSILTLTDPELRTEPAETLKADVSASAQTTAPLSATPVLSLPGKDDSQPAAAVSAAVRPAPPHAKNAGTELSLRLGATAPPASHWAWINWSALVIFLAGMAALSFFAGLRTGGGRLSSVLAAFSRSSPQVESTGAGASLFAATTPVIGRTAITSRLYVPVAIPTTPDAAKTSRLQVGAVEHRVEPQYPPDAINKRTEGTVQLHLTIDASGTVQNVTTISGPSSLVQSATDALRQWQFKPTLLDGKPIQTEADIAVVFWLRPAPQRSESKSQ